MIAVVDCIRYGQCFIVYQALLKVFTGLNPLLFIKKFLVMEFAFSTATSNATIPMSIDTLLAKKMGGVEKDLIFYDTAFVNDHGWYLDHAGRGRCICSTGI